jgi:protein phosphatase
MKYYVCVESNIGNVRTRNEDNYLCNNFYKRDLQLNTVEFNEVYNSNLLNIFAVFDGMGGLSEGNLSSYLCANCLKKYVENLEEKFNGKYVINLMNKILCDKKKELGTQLGSTVAIIKICNGKMEAFNVGDSRIYIYRKEKLNQISEDHTEEAKFNKVQEALGIKKDNNFKYKHILTQHLGIDENDFLLEPFCSNEFTLKENDIILLCSDGLTSMVNDEEIKLVLEENIDLVLKKNKLIKTALKKGGNDNITVILLEVKR